MRKTVESLVSLLGILLAPAAVVAAPTAPVPVAELVPQYLFGMQSTALAWSPDGTRMAVGSYDGYVRIIERRTAIIEHAWPMNRAAIVLLTYSPDGSGLLVLADVGETESTLLKLDAATGAVLERKAMAGPARAALSGDGKVLAVMRERERTVELLDTATLSALPAARIPEGVTVRAMALSPDGRLVALGEANGTVMLLDRSAPTTIPPPATESTPAAPSCGQGPVTALTFSPDGSTLACAAEKAQALTLMTVPSLSRAGELAAPESDVRWATFLQAGKTVLMASGAGLREIGVADGVEVRELRSGEGDVLSVAAAAVAPDGKGLGVADGFSLLLFDSMEQVGRKLGPDVVENYRAAISADASLAVFTQPVSTASFSIDLTTGARAAEWKHGESSPDFWSALDAKGKTAAVKTSSYGFRIVDPRTGKILQSVDMELESGTFMTALSPDGSLVLGSRYEAGQCLYDVKAGQWGKTLETQCSGLPAAFSPDNRTLYVAPGDSYSSDICVVDLKTGADVGLLRDAKTGGTLFDFALSPSGTRLVSVYASPNVLVWDTARKEVSHRVELPEAAMLAAFSPDEKSAAVLAMSGKLYLWEFVSGKPPRALDAAVPGAPLAAVFNADGKRLFIADTLGSVRVVDLASGRTLATTQVMGNGDWLTWSPEGWFEGTDGAIELFRVRTGEGFVPLKERASEWRKAEKIKEILSGR